MALFISSGNLSAVIPMRKIIRGAALQGQHEAAGSYHDPALAKHGKPTAIGTGPIFSSFMAY